MSLSVSGHHSVALPRCVGMPALLRQFQIALDEFSLPLFRLLPWCLTQVVFGAVSCNIGLLNVALNGWKDSKIVRTILRGDMGHGRS